VTNLWRDPPPDEPVSRRYLRILAGEGLVDDEYAPPAIRLTADERARGAAVLAAHAPPGPPVVLVPGAGMAVKHWPHWPALAAALVRQGTPALVVAGSPAPGPWAAELAVPLPATDLRGLAAVFAAVADRDGVVVGPDTGPVRVAAAAGARTVGLFGPTAAARYGVAEPAPPGRAPRSTCRACPAARTAARPRSPSSLLVGGDLPAVPGRPACMAAIDVTAVVARSRGWPFSPPRAATRRYDRSSSRARPASRPVELATTLAGLAAQDHPFDVLVSDQSRRAASFDTRAGRTMARCCAARAGRCGMAATSRAGGSPSTARSLLASSRPTGPVPRRRRLAGPGTVARLHDAIDRLGCGMVGCAMQGLSYLDDERPDELVAFERWPGRPEPERLEPGTPQWERWRLHNAANPAHLARRHVRPGEAWVAYKVAWIAGCVLYDRAELVAAGGFDFWREVPENAVGEDVVAQQRVMERAGGAGILPSGAVHLESATTMPDRPVTADAVLRAVVATG
jgi:hypothetical protein